MGFNKIYIEHRFGQIPNELLNNQDISLKSKGLYGYMQSKPDGWEFSAKKIANQTKDGIKSIQNGLKELEENGYLIREKIRENGEFKGINYTITVKPFRENAKRDIPKQENISKKEPSKKELSNITELTELTETRNSIVLESKNKIKLFKQLPKIRKINNQLKSIYNIKRKEYSIEEIKKGLNNYLENIRNRKYKDGSDYHNHRFTLLKFLKQSNGLDEYINL